MTERLLVQPPQRERAAQILSCCAVDICINGQPPDVKKTDRKKRSAKVAFQKNCMHKSPVLCRFCSLGTCTNGPFCAGNSPLKRLF